MLSEDAYRQVRRAPDIAFADAGQHEVKNVPEPVQAWQVLMPGDAVRAPVRSLRTIGLGLAALFVVVVLAMAWVFTASDEAPVTAETLALPDQPSIVVLPFTNRSDDANQEYFADGLTDDLITDLSKFSQLFVIASNSSFAYKGKPTKVQTIAQDLGVRYVLEGSVERNREALRINAQLIDAQTGHHLWAERYEGDFGDVFAFRDQVLGQIVANLSIELAGAPENVETMVPEAYDAFLQGRNYVRRGTPQDMLIAIEHFARAIELDPDYGRAHAEMAAAYWANVTHDWEIAIGSDWQRLYERAVVSVERALALGTPEAYAVHAEILAMQGRHEEALAEVDKAVALGPNNAMHHASRARVLNFIGRAPEAAESALTAMRLDPHYPPNYLRQLALSRFHMEQYEEAAELLKRVVGRQPDVEFDWNTLIAAHGHLGRRDDVAALIAQRETITGSKGVPLTVQNAGFYWYGDTFSHEPSYIERLEEGARLAGVPEGSGQPERYAEYKARISKSNGEYAVRGATKINAAKARDLAEQGALFVDARAVLNHEVGHVPGAISLNLWGGLSEAALRAHIGKDDPVVFYCWGKYCPISAWASSKAVTWGFTRVYYFAGGLPAWEDAGYPTESVPMTE